MQLMPATASFIARDRGFSGRKRHQLFDQGQFAPESGLYPAFCWLNRWLKSSLVRLLAAYNGGPGNLRKWLNKVDHQDDPFLLVESIPARETRYYVKHVISNLGMYRQRFGREAPALSGLAAGNGGVFVPQFHPLIRLVYPEGGAFMDHSKRIDQSASFVPVNIAILTVSDSRRADDDRSGDLLAARAD